VVDKKTWRKPGSSQSAKTSRRGGWEKVVKGSKGKGETKRKISWGGGPNAELNYLSGLVGMERETHGTIGKEEYKASKSIVK